MCYNCPLSFMGSGKSMSSLTAAGMRQLFESTFLVCELGRVVRAWMKQVPEYVS